MEESGDCCHLCIYVLCLSVFDGEAEDQGYEKGAKKPLPSESIHFK